MGTGRPARVPGVEVLGTVVRLQVQRSRLKLGERGARRYDPAPLREVEALEIGPRGVLGLVPGEEPVIDVHNADHPDTRNVKLANGLSLLPQPHYGLMRQRFGAHLHDGIAGENLLLATEGPLTEDDLGGSVVLETADGRVLELSDVMVAAPCVEFTRFALGRSDLAVDDDILQAMPALDDGVRGFYATARGTGRVRRGCRLLRR
jgi:hypothetical protein